MKILKIFIIFTALILLPFWAGCEKEAGIPAGGAAPETGEIQERQQGAAEKIIYDDGFMFSYNGADIYMGEYIKNILPLLGAEAECAVSDSCTSEGTMAIYAYDSVEISAYTKTEEDEYRVFSATFRDDSVATAEGIHIGQSVGEMEAAYEDYGADLEKMEGFYYKYLKNGTAVSFDIDGGVIIGITYQLLVI